MPQVGDQGVFLAGGADFSSMQNAVGGMVGTLGSFAGKLGIAAGAMAGFAAAMVPAIKQANQFEQNVAELAKLVGEDLARPLAVSIGDLATRLPVARQRLFEVAEAAVRLGVRGRENILQFTETMAQIEVATDLSADVAAEKFARIAAVTGTPIDRIDDLADTVNALSNEMATSFSEIVQSMGELAPALSQIGTPAEDIAALAASVNEVNISVSKGSRRLRSFFQQIRDVGNAEDLARALNLSRERFIQLTESGDGARQVLIRVLETMREGGDDARLLRSTLRNAANQGVGALTLRISALQESMLNATDAMSDSANSLEEEFGKFFQTAGSQMEILRNQIDQTQREFGDDFLRMQKDVIEFGQAVLEALDFGEPFEQLPERVGSKVQEALGELTQFSAGRLGVPSFMADMGQVSENLTDVFFRLEGAQREVFTESFVRRLREAKGEIESNAEIMGLMSLAAREASQAATGLEESFQGIVRAMVESGTVTEAQGQRLVSTFRGLQGEIPIGKLRDFRDRSRNLADTLRSNLNEEGADTDKLLRGMVQLLEEAAAGFESAGEEAGDAAGKMDAAFTTIERGLERVPERFRGLARRFSSDLTVVERAGLKTVDQLRDVTEGAEQSSDRLETLRRRLQGTGISVDRFRGSLSSLTEEEFQQLLTRIDMVNRTAERMADSLTDAFVNVIGGTESVADAFVDMVDSILEEMTRLLVRQTITQPLSQILSGFLAGAAGGATGNATQSGVASTGFQHGGSFVVPGSGGPDSKFVAFRATPGERVDVTPGGRERPDGDTFNAKVEVTINAADAKSVKRLVEENEGIFAEPAIRAMNESVSARRAAFGG